MTKIKYFFFTITAVFITLLIAGCQNPSGADTVSKDTTKLSAPTDVTVKASTSAKNDVVIEWTSSEASNYWIYYNTKNDSSTATVLTYFGYSGYSKTLTASGTYYFWVKGADGSSSTSNTSDFSAVASIEFTYTKLSAPTDVTVTASTSVNNDVVIKWTSSEASNYWIYYNTTNDSSNATVLTRSGFSGYSKTLTASGTYYFWVKGADDYLSTSNTSDFSAVASIEFTYTKLSAPTDVTVTASTSVNNKVEIKWTSSKASCYWIYYNTTNDSSNAILFTRSVFSGCSKTLTASGTYYFWVKGADGSSSTSNTSDFSAVATYTIE